MYNRNRIKDPLGDRVFMGINYLFLVLVLIVVAYPLLYIVSSSFSSSRAVTSGQIWLLPVDFNIKAYISIFKSTQLMMGFYNTIIYTVVGTAINVILTVMLAYPLSRRTFYGRGAIIIFMMITMFFDGGLIPTYLLMKDLHLLDTRWAMWLPGALAVFQVIVARTFFNRPFRMNCGRPLRSMAARTFVIWSALCCPYRSRFWQL